MSCLDPPLEFLPQSDWYCKSCLETYDDLTFDRDSQPIIYPVDFRYPGKKKKEEEEGGAEVGILREAVAEAEEGGEEGKRIL